MKINKINNFNKISFKSSLPYPCNAPLSTLIPQIGMAVQLPDGNRNYTLFNQNLVKQITDYKEAALPHLWNYLSVVQEEKQAAEGLYILDRMIEAGVKGIDKFYPVICRFDRTSSPTIQVLLAGIYRKIKVPDAFGPLMSMLIKNTFQPPNVSFDPNQEIGGALLELLRNNAANDLYKK